MADPGEDRAALQAFDRLASLAPAEREAALAALPEPLRRRVQRMLAALDTPTAFPAPPERAPHRPGERYGAWRLQRLLGRGGMAEVWLGEPIEGRLQRPAAIKLPLALHGELADRFDRERDVLAALDHPHIARLYDAGQGADGQPFLALELVDGEPITEHAARLNLGRAARLQLALQMLRALLHAHARLVVHRDLKPSNVLVNAQGQVKLLDFGIAKLLAPPPGSQLLTQDAAQLLTPRYCAPEQVRGDAITTATDVYAAGVLLYELFTGRTPYAGPEATLAQTLHAVLNTAPTRPGLDARLDAILLRCLAKEPEARYASVERLIDDLQRWADGRPVAAKRVSLPGVALLWVKRHRRTAAVALGALLLLGAALGFGLQQRLEARTQAQRTDAVRQVINNMLSDAEPAEGRTEVSGADLLAAAVQQVRGSLQDSPRVRAELLGELARVQIRLQQWAAARETLEEALRAYEGEVDEAHALRNRARAYLASLLVWGNEAERARGERLARQAVQACPVADAECALSHGSAHYALWLLSTRRADDREGLVQARAMAAAAAKAPSSFVAQRVDALETLAGAALFAGRLGESRYALDGIEALRSQTPIKTVNQQRLQWLRLTLDGLQRDPAAAADALLHVSESLHVAAERPRVLRAVAQLQLLAARPAAALAALDSLASAPGSPLDQAFTQSTRAGALLALGDLPQAQAALNAAEAAAQQAGVVPHSLFLQRLHRLQALAALQSGDDATAARLLPGLARSDSPLDAARALGLQACLALRAGDAAQAHAPATQALQTLQAPPLDAAHPLVRRLDLLAAWARGGSGETERQALQQSLPADSPWQARPPRDCRDLGL